MKFNRFFILLLAFFTIFSIIFGNYGVAEAKEEDYTARAYYLIDYNTGTVLSEKNSNDKFPVASIVKLMTIELVCEEIESGNLSIDEMVTASSNSASMGGSQVFIEEGGQYSVGDLLKSTIISSANDASVALAERISGSESEFVHLMNKKAMELGLDNTFYVNCTGLPAVGQFSCARDTAVLLKKVSSHDVYHQYSTIWMDTLSHPKGRESELVNTNKLIRYFEGCDGGKTGSTSEAGYCLSATAKRGDMRLIGVVLGAENSKLRFAETSKLLNYGFSNFENKKVVDKDSSKFAYTIPVKHGKEKSVSASPIDDLFALSKKHDSTDTIETKVEIADSVCAPITKGDRVGTIYVIKNGQVIAETDIVCATSVDSQDYLDNIDNIIDQWKIK